MNALDANPAVRAPFVTKERILDAAERLFAEHGLAATSLRMITAQAGVNLAAVNYHFQSKEALIQAVFARRIGPINQKRLKMLDECEASANAKPSLEAIVRALVDPVIRAKQEAEVRGSDFGPLLGRMYVEPGDNVRRILMETMREIARRFADAFRRVLPGLPPVELFWRLHFAVGVLLHTLAGRDHLAVVSGGLCDPGDPDAVIERMVTFLVAGLRAPVSFLSTRG